MIVLAEGQSASTAATCSDCTCGYAHLQAGVRAGSGAGCSVTMSPP